MCLSKHNLILLNFIDFYLILFYCVLNTNQWALYLTLKSHSLSECGYSNHPMSVVILYNLFDFSQTAAHICLKLHVPWLDPYQVFFFKCEVIPVFFIE